MHLSSDYRSEYRSLLQDKAEKELFAELDLLAVMRVKEVNPLLLSRIDVQLSAVIDEINSRPILPSSEPTRAMLAPSFDMEIYYDRS